jgi:hypothetical protein
LAIAHEKAAPDLHPARPCRDNLAPYYCTMILPVIIGWIVQV